MAHVYPCLADDAEQPILRSLASPLNERFLPLQEAVHSQLLEHAPEAFLLALWPADWCSGPVGMVQGKQGGMLGDSVAGAEHEEE